MSGKTVNIDLIAGLGNPGSKYEQTRHNAGFWFVEEIARLKGAQFRPESKFSGDVCKVELQGREIWLLKPDTFMNRSGLAVHKLASFYKIPTENILVAHDELDLEPGTARLKTAGGHGGHNGLRDIIAQMGKEFHRLRIAIGHPGHRDQVSDYVLHRPAKDEQISIENSIDDALRVLPLLAEGSWEKAVHRLHSK
ncbi:Peptidyl-tRNA hydrolase [hydrothermal vent metagenome]|uniref:peptidyl-tRNA hydrolase n=1 Tax=hydrothermal vent metagenome TaxID=652676 RepID=A0A3B0YHK0_9ZZZZ